MPLESQATRDDFTS